MRARLKGWVVCGLLLGTMVYAIAEEVTLTTYYPSPRGVYKALRVTDDVGIGTTVNPTERLGVRGSIALDDDNADGPQLRLFDDTTTPWEVDNFRGRLRFFRPGIEFMTITAGGNVGIGTVNPEMELDIAGTSGMLLLRDSKTPTSSALEVGMVSGNRVFFHSYARSGAPILPLTFDVGDTRVMNMMESGNVGIGTTTPQFARLMIEDAAVPLALRETGVAADAGGLWRMPIDGGDLRFDINTSAAGDFSTYIAPLQITKEGKVSVSRAPGGTPPQANLTVVGLCPGCILDSGVTFSNPTIEVQTPRGVGSAVGPFLRLNHRGPGGSDWWIGSAGSADDSPGDLGTLQFWLGFKGAGPPGIKMAIRQNGDVGIGTSTPNPSAPNGAAGNLEVNDLYLRSMSKWASQTGNNLQSPNGDYTLAMQDDGNIVLYTRWGVRWVSNTFGGNFGVDNLRSQNGRYYLAMQNDRNLVIYDTVLGWNPVWASQSTLSCDGSCFSDISLKENIATLDNALMKMGQLRGVSFNWKDKSLGEGRQIGLIAQEVEKTFPEVVTADGNGLKSVQYHRLVAPLIEAIKEQQAQIDTQGRLIRQLQEELKGLRAELARQ